MIEPFEGINKMPPWKKEEYASALKEAEKNTENTENPIAPLKIGRNKY